MNKILQIALVFIVVILVMFGIYTFVIQDDTTPTQTITYVVSHEDTRTYCDGASVDSAGYAKTLVMKKAINVSLKNPTKNDLIQATIAAATTGMCHDVMTKLDITEENGIVSIPPIDGWAGISIVMCSCQPQVEVNMLQIPGITEVVWSSSST